MACEITPTVVGTQIFEHQHSSRRIGLNDADVEIDEMGVIGRVALGGADSMGIVAGRTGHIFIYDVRLVHSSRAVAGDDVSIVALVTQCV
jgi:hypothetical protein